MFWKVPTPSTSCQGPEDLFTCWPDQVDPIEEFFLFCYCLSWWVYGVHDKNIENSLHITEKKLFSLGGKKKDVSGPWLHHKPKSVDLQINVCSWSEGCWRLMGADSLTCRSRSLDGGSE